MVIVVEALAGNEPRKPLVVGGQIVVWPLSPLVPNRIDGTAAEDVSRCVNAGGDQSHFPSEEADQ